MKAANRSANDSFSMFLQGKGAIYPAVTSFLADAEKTLGDDCGVLMPPDFDAGASLQNSTVGGPGQSFVVAKNTKHPEMAVKLISFLNSKAEVLEAQKINRWPVVRNDVTPADEQLVGHMFSVAARIAAQEGIAADGYRLLVNCNKHGGQEVFHLHMHLLGGRFMGPMVVRK